MDANVSISQPAGVAGAAAEASRLKPGDSEVNNLCLRLSRWLRRFRDTPPLVSAGAQLLCSSILMLPLAGIVHLVMNWLD